MTSAQQWQRCAAESLVNNYGLPEGTAFAVAERLYQSETKHDTVPRHPGTIVEWHMRSDEEPLVDPAADYPVPPWAYDFPEGETCDFT